MDGKRKAVAMKVIKATTMADFLFNDVDWKKAETDALWLPSFFGDEEFRIDFRDGDNREHGKIRTFSRRPDDIFDFSTRDYTARTGALTWHSDGYDYTKRIVGCTEGHGQLWFARGPFKGHDDSMTYRGSISLGSGNPRSVKGELRRYPLKPGDVIAFTREWERKYHWVHGGPPGVRSGFVCRFV
jgi:hypothetical protein